MSLHLSSHSCIYPHVPAFILPFLHLSSRPCIYPQVPAFILMFLHLFSRPCIYPPISAFILTFLHLSSHSCIYPHVPALILSFLPLIQLDTSNQHLPFHGDWSQEFQGKINTNYKHGSFCGKQLEVRTWVFMLLFSLIHGVHFPLHEAGICKLM